LFVTFYIDDYRKKSIAKCITIIVSSSSSAREALVVVAYALLVNKSWKWMSS